MDIVPLKESLTAVTVEPLSGDLMSEGRELVTGILKDNIRLFILSFVIFILGVPVGYLTYEDAREHLTPVLEKLRSMVVSKSKMDMAYTIFLNNLRVSLIIVVSGVFIILPFFILFTNGFLMGFVVKLSEVSGRDYMFLVKALLPHSFFEMSAIFLSSTLGIRTGLSIIFPKEKTRLESMVSRIREASLIYLLVVVPLLLIAAFIEAYITSSLVM